MGSNTVTFSNTSFLKKQMFKLKINSALKYCDEIKQAVKVKYQISPEDYRINLIVANPEKEDFEEMYFALKGYDSDGSLRPLMFYTMKDEKLVQVFPSEKSNILVLDMYEESVFLHSYKIDDSFAEGYIVKQELIKNCYNVILSPEKVKVKIKNANSYEQYKDVKEFIDTYLL